MRLKRLAAALGNQSDYDYDKQFSGGNASRRNKRNLHLIITRIQRRKDKHTWEGDVR